MENRPSGIVATYDMVDERSRLTESGRTILTNVRALDGLLASVENLILEHQSVKIDSQEARSILFNAETWRKLEQIASSLLGKRISIFDSTGWRLAGDETVTGYSIFEKGIVFYFPKRMGDYGDGFVKFTLGQGMKVVRSESESF